MARGGRFAGGGRLTGGGRVAGKGLRVALGSAVAVMASNGLAVGCGGSSIPAGAVVVKLTRLSFMPATVVVRSGTLVVWQWRDPGVPDNVVSTPTGPLHSAIQTHGRYSYRFTSIGTYNYVSTLHEADGMIGTVIVR